MRRSRFVFGIIFLAITLVITPVARPSGAFTLINFPGGSATQAFGVNLTNEIVGQYMTSGKLLHGFMFSGGSYGDLVAPGGTSVTVALGINDSAAIVGYFGSSDFPQGFLLQGAKIVGTSVQGTYKTINYPGATDTVAAGINNGGVIVGYYDDTTGTHGFQYNGTFTALNVPSSVFTQAWGINSTGQITGRYIDASGNTHGFLYAGGTFTTIDVPATLAPAPAFTWGRGINSHCLVVGRYVDGTTGNVIGFTSQGSTFNSYVATGAVSQTGVFGINDNGQIVGSFDTGTDVSGNTLYSGFMDVSPTANTGTCPGSGNNKHHKHHDRDDDDSHHHDNDRHQNQNHQDNDDHGDQDRD